MFFVHLSLRLRIKKFFKLYKTNPIINLFVFWNSQLFSTIFYLLAPFILYLFSFKYNEWLKYNAIHKYAL